MSDDPSVSTDPPEAEEKDRTPRPDRSGNRVCTGNDANAMSMACIWQYLYYLGLRRGEALGLQWGDFDFDEDLVHIQRDIDFCWLYGP